MPGALFAAMCLGWTAAIVAWVMGAPFWLGLLLLPAVGSPALVIAALLAARRPAQRAGTLQPVRA